jgi:hypothetical protein
MLKNIFLIFADAHISLPYATFSMHNLKRSDCAGEQAASRALSVTNMDLYHI